MRYTRWIPLTLTLFLVGCTKPAEQAAPPSSTPGAPPTAASPAPSMPEAAKPGAAQPEAAKPEAAKPEASTPAPSTPGAKAPAPAPGLAATPAGSDPIVGKWEMKTPQASVVFIMSPGGKVELDPEATRKGLTSALEQQIQKDPNTTPEQKQQVMQEMRAALEQQMQAFEGKWAKVGKLYKITNQTPGAKGAEPTWARVEGDRLISTDAKGAAKKGDPVAQRIG